MISVHYGISTLGELDRLANVLMESVDKKESYNTRTDNAFSCVPH
jgi:hypothetical protein